MLRRRRIGAFAIILVIGLWGERARAQDLSLTEDSEAGFGRLIHTAQSGGLGADVVNANIFIAKDHVDVELLCGTPPIRHLVLRPARAKPAASRYFEIETGEGARAEDATRLALVLDQIFQEDPFQSTAGLFESPAAGDFIPRLLEAWSEGGGVAAFHVLARQMTALASLSYTLFVIAGSTAGLLWSLALLWGTRPTDSENLP
ncbi:MAG TPA: hypothetical protein VMT89_15970 [Candidatus Acidoferrales bacterium]|nr:hypothetical protein [Candidatus Acidoferrales bacterium]